MWLTAPLLVTILALQIHVCVAQLGNSTYSPEEILDIYEPLFFKGNKSRIIGGSRINIRQVPWQIALFDDARFICGGSIISRDWVLTAAHCLESPGRISIRAGSPTYRTGGQVRYAKSIVVNSGYNSNTLNHDVALIRVRRPFIFTPRARAVTLAKPWRSLPPRYFVSGWGNMREDDNRIPRRIRGVTVRKVRQSVCRRKYSVDNIRITRTMICAGTRGKDHCYGDSGGPVVHKRIQYGIVSFAVGCARAQYPGVSTDVRREYFWIRRVIRRMGGQLPRYV